MTTAWIVIPAVFATSIAITIALYFASRRSRARRTGERLSRSLGLIHEVFTALEQVPDVLITRDLRRGLVLLISHHVQILNGLAPRHPYLNFVQQRLARLNRLPSGMTRNTLRSRQQRREASLALERLSGILKGAAKTSALEQKQADIASAAAQFAAQQMAVETARQAAKDAENVRAYKQALNFAYQAQALCQKLPPLVGKALDEAVAQDVTRLEAALGKPARA